MKQDYTYIDNKKNWKMMDNDDNAFMKAASLASAQVFPAILNAAVDMNLFDIISNPDTPFGMSASQIASKLPMQHSHLTHRLERMLPLLAVHSLLHCSIHTNQNGDTHRLYSLSPVGIYFTPNHHQQQGTSFASFSTLIYQGFRHLWKDTKDAIMDGKNENHFSKVYGKMAFEYMETEDRELGKLFGQAMFEAGSLGMKQILNAYKGFEGISTLVEVGGGIGQVLTQILLQYPSIKGINFDLPHVVKNAPPHLGIQHIGGDMFKTVPKGDVILLKHVCHNWGDEECVEFLRKCYEALPEHGGKVIVLDTLLPEIPKSTSDKDIGILNLDFVMFLVHGGKERSEKEFEELCKRSGFSRFEVACNDSSAVDAVMEFYK